MWPLFSILAILYAALFLFKSKYHVLSEQIFEKYGLDIGLFQIKLSLSAKRRWVTNIPTMKKCKNFYKYGTIISLVLIIPSLIFLIWNLYKIITLAWPSTTPTTNQSGTGLWSFFNTCQAKMTWAMKEYVKNSKILFFLPRPQVLPIDIIVIMQT